MILYYKFLQYILRKCNEIWIICCPTASLNGFNGIAILVHYIVNWEGSKGTVSIYINMYDYGELKAPVGFTIKK